jgi:hypothetical protein
MGLRQQPNDDDRQQSAIPEEHTHLAQLLTAAAATARTSPLPGEEQAMAAFRVAG